PAEYRIHVLIMVFQNAMQIKRGQIMKYQALTCVWEITMGCNMRCKHCGSSCAEALPDELNTEEALNVCDQIADMGLKWITLSGGEPLTRKDVHLLVKRLSDKGVSVNIITNGWFLEEEMVLKLKGSNISTIAVSIDGTEEIHDNIRKKGAFAQARKAFQLMKREGIQTGAITTVSKKNIEFLTELKENLISMGVDSWQVQIGLPMGNFKKRPEWVLDPEQVNDLIDFCYDTAKEGRIKIYPADCIGYYTKKEMEIKRISYNTPIVSLWDGCNAGTRSFGILHNGDILGCTSIRDKQYVEGNLRNESLRSIWESDEKFSWCRSMKKCQLDGDCNICIYGKKCLGGCPNTRLTMNGSIYSENQYCAYNLELKDMKNRYSNNQDGEILYAKALQLMKEEQFQEAAFAFERVHELMPENREALRAKGFCEYMCGNYERCLEDNERALKLEKNDPEALKGKGIALSKLGRKEDGINCLNRAAILTDFQDGDILNDLVAISK
ncbi:radical SAM protein, partial [Lacrimispora sp. 38-1]|uniref:radical SAM protein n=1 Tax=Lacrimispora sp. 38-1 TaxID=3125778 RepID=UPI003CF406CD